MTVQEVISKLEEKKTQLFKDHSNRVGDEFWRRGEMNAIEFTLSLLKLIPAESKESINVWVSRDFNDPNTFEFHETEPILNANGLYSPSSEYGLITTAQRLTDVFPIQAGEKDQFQITKLTP